MVRENKWVIIIGFNFGLYILFCLKVEPFIFKEG